VPVAAPVADSVALSAAYGLSVSVDRRFPRRYFNACLVEESVRSRDIRPWR
jgi:hypothetical protein